MENGEEAKSSLEEEPGGGSFSSNGQEFIRDTEQLSAHLPFNQEEISTLKEVESSYHLRIPHYYFSLISDAFDRQDPIRKQCIPSLEELSQNSSETEDPLAEQEASVGSCLVHRYPDRVLLLVTNRCFMYCRHCTRKRLWAKNIKEPSLNDIESALDYIGSQEQIREVIISGGDPLTLSSSYLDKILSGVAACKNIQVVRIGTRTPVVFPQRIDDDLCRVLEKYDNIWINVQFNHPREITPKAASACKKLQKLGIPINNQSVLLKGVNDNLSTMLELCQKLQSIRVRPYYLFQCDSVAGTFHFRTSPFVGRALIEKMQGYTGGICVPNFVIDSAEGKIPLGPNYLVSETERWLILKNYKNDLLFYPRSDDSKKKAKNQNLIKTIGITFNLKAKGVSDGCEEYDEIETIASLKKEIEALGFKVRLFEQGESFLKEISDNRPDFVFNLAEGRGNFRGRESQLPAVLESLSIPYSGSDPISLGITLDKYLTNRLLRSANIPVPEMFMVKNMEELENLGNIFTGGQLFLVKPRWEGSSKGIFLNSLVSNFDDLRKRVENIFLKYQQPALIEEFLEKDEITVGVYGNRVARILGMMKIVPKDRTCDNFFYSFEVKQDWQNKVKYEPQESILESIQKLVQLCALRAYRELELKDIARIDFRLDSQNKPRIIDINPLPGLSPLCGDLPILYKLSGGNYNDLIKLILQEALSRYGLSFN